MFRFLLFLIMSSIIVFSQNQSPVSNVKGQVVDYQTQQTLPGTTIRLLDTKFGTYAKKKMDFLK